MSWILYQKELKSNYKILLLFLVVITMYSSIIIAMYDPDMNSSLEILAKSMPQIFAAFGMMNIATTLLDFITNYLYGFILIVFPFLLSVILCYRLIGQYVDHGSMAYLLATPLSRQQFMMTQLMVLLTALVIVVIYAFGFISIYAWLMVKDASIDMISFLSVNIGLLGIHCLLGSLCYLSCALFNEAKLSIGFGAGLGIVFILIQMLSDVSQQFEILNYLTPLTLFDPQSLSSGEYQAFVYVFILFVSALLLFGIGQCLFKKRDLPL